MTANAIDAPVTAAARPVRRRRRVAVLRAAGLVAVFLVCVFPFYWMVATSLKDQAVALASPPVWLFTPTLDHYVSALTEHGVGASLINSIIVALATTALAILLGTPAAYALARYDFKGKGELWFWFITNRMVSPIVLALPFFILARNIQQATGFQLIDTHLVLILLYLTFNLPIVVWICADQCRENWTTRRAWTAPAASRSSGGSHSPWPRRGWWFRPSSRSSSRGTNCFMPWC